MRPQCNTSTRTEPLVVLQRPKWDDSVGGHVLNFHGRVTKSSVKNFQLGCDVCCPLSELWGRAPR